MSFVNVVFLPDGVFRFAKSTPAQKQSLACNYQFSGNRLILIANNMPFAEMSVQFLNAAQISIRDTAGNSITFTRIQ